MQKIKRPNGLKATAHHEAGHAVAAILSHTKFKYVTIVPDRAAGTLGLMPHEGLPKSFTTADEFGQLSGRSRLRVERYIVLTLAGQIAEERFLGSKPVRGISIDNRNVVDVAACLQSSRRTEDAFIQYCWCAAQHLVEQRWPEIEAIATALLERKTLKYQDALKVFGQPPLHRPPVSD